MFGWLGEWQYNERKSGTPLQTECEYNFGCIAFEVTIRLPCYPVDFWICDTE